MRRLLYSCLAISCLACAHENTIDGMFQELNPQEQGQVRADEDPHSGQIEENAANPNYLENVIQGVYQELELTAMQKQELETMLNRANRRVLLPLVLLYVCCPSESIQRFFNTDEAQGWDYLKLLGYSSVAAAAAAYDIFDVTALAELDKKEADLRSGIQEIDRICRMSMEEEVGDDTHE